MASGPLPKPTALKLAEGNASKQSKEKLNLAQPVPEDLKSLEPPAWLSDDAKAKWNHYAPIYQRIGMLKSADYEKFGHYMQDVADVIRLRLEIRAANETTEGINKKGSTYSQLHVKINYLAQVLDRMNKLGQQFGDSPAARAKLSVDGGNEKSSLAAFLARKPVKKPPTPAPTTQ